MVQSLLTLGAVSYMFNLEIKNFKALKNKNDKKELPHLYILKRGNPNPSQKKKKTHTHSVFSILDVTLVTSCSHLVRRKINPDSTPKSLKKSVFLFSSLRNPCALFLSALNAVVTKSSRREGGRRCRCTATAPPPNFSCSGIVGRVIFFGRGGGR